MAQNRKQKKKRIDLDELFFSKENAGKEKKRKLSHASACRCDAKQNRCKLSLLCYQDTLNDLPLHKLNGDKNMNNFRKISKYSDK